MEGITIKHHKVNLSNEKLLLREFTKYDWMNVHSYASQDIVCQFQPREPNTETESKNFVNQVIIDVAEQPRTRFALAIIYNDVLVGTGEF